jgi:hypothetical protein
MYNSFLMVFFVILYLFSSNIEKVTNMYTFCAYISKSNTTWSFAKALNDIINHCKNGVQYINKSKEKDFFILNKDAKLCCFSYMFHKILNIGNG